MKEKIAEAERYLSGSYYNFKLDKENKAIDKMYVNKKSFFTYMKSKNKEKTKIGPFVDNKGKVIDDIPANTLQKQYCDMWSSPKLEDRIDNPDEFFDDSDKNAEPRITGITFTMEKIRKAINKVRIDAAPGPDGISPYILKTFCDEILSPLEAIYTDSMDNSIFPAIWKKSDVSPVKKSGKSKSRAESFRPVALLSHLGKIMEVVIREELQTFLENNNKLA